VIELVVFIRRQLERATASMYVVRRVFFKIQIKLSRQRHRHHLASTLRGIDTFQLNSCGIDDIIPAVIEPRLHHVSLKKACSLV
jgi:hypothetical protein